MSIPEKVDRKDGREGLIGLIEGEGRERLPVSEENEGRRLVVHPNGLL